FGHCTLIVITWVGWSREYPAGIVIVSRKSSQVLGTAEQSGPSEPGMLLVGLEPVMVPVQVTGEVSGVSVPDDGVAARALPPARAASSAAVAMERSACDMGSLLREEPGEPRAGSDGQRAAGGPMRRRRGWRPVID